MATNYQRNLKVTQPGLVMAIHADAKSFPGGISGIANIIGVNATTLSNNLNVNHESPVPSFGTVVEVMKLSQHSRGIRALASIMGLTVSGAELQGHEPKDIMKEFVELIHDASSAINKGSASMMDGEFSRAEARELEPIIQNLIKSALEVDAVIKSMK